MNSWSSGEDVAGEVAELQEKTDRTRSRFLRAEMQTCALALDMARLEYERRNPAYADREVSTAEQGVAVIERFLPQVRPEDQGGLREQLSQLRTALESLKRDFDVRSNPSAQDTPQSRAPE